MEHQTPKIAEPSQVKIRSLEVGVCGTDREICTFVYGSPPDGFDYLVQDPGAGASKGLYPLRELHSDIEALRFYERLNPAPQLAAQHF